jgi:hypothetical protein
MITTRYLLLRKETDLLRRKLERRRLSEDVPRRESSNHLNTARKRMILRLLFNKSLVQLRHKLKLL